MMREVFIGAGGLGDFINRGLLDNKTMAALNHEVDVAKRNPRDVVRDFLRNHSPKKPTNK